MQRRSSLISSHALGISLLTLSACAVQPRLHSARELTALADRCDVRETELAQHRTRPEIFYFLRPTATEPQLICVARWAKKNHLRLVYVEAVEETPESPET
jgi:hypothetical protein